MAQNGAVVLRECQKRCIPGLVAAWFLLHFDPVQAPPLRMAVPIDLKRFPVCLGPQYASIGGPMAQNGAVVPRE